jgi:type III secretion system FlhB-like substrate exporter
MVRRGDDEAFTGGDNKTIVELNRRHAIMVQIAPKIVELLLMLHLPYGPMAIYQYIMDEY